MLEALWSVEFLSNVEDWGTGVVVLETQRVLGGDAQYIYIGSYRVDKGEVHANVKVTHYAGEPLSIFGPAKQFTLELKGNPARDVFEMHGYVVENPTLQIGMRLTRRADLP